MGDRKRGPDSYDNGPRKEFKTGPIIKMLCPFYSAGAIIGDGGKEIKSIKEEHGIGIQVSKKDVRFPNTDERVITMQGECETLKKVVHHVQGLIRNDKPPPSAKSVDIEGNEKRKRALKLVISDTSAGRIIGKGGESIKQLKEKFAVVINTSKKHDLPENLDERIVSVEGDHDEVDKAVDDMIDTVCNDRQARMQWFVDYAALSGRGGYNDRGGSRDGGYGGYDKSSYGGGYGGGYGGAGGYGGGAGGGYGGAGGYGSGGYNSSGYNGGGYDRGYSGGGRGGGYDDGYGAGDGGRTGGYGGSGGGYGGRR